MTKRYLPEVPVDPRTGSRYVYGVTNDGQFFQVAGIYQNTDGTWEARTQDNLAKGFELPGIVRAYDSPNFVVQRDTFLPYNPDHMILAATARNVTGTVTVDGQLIKTGALLAQDTTVVTDVGSGLDIYFSD
ncbi:hypothetical protein COY07_02150, partial [Candidatus Peregrinibacteria bacterium CG_4_10_14_0_2_um_filter_43_11]